MKKILKNRIKKLIQEQIGFDDTGSPGGAQNMFHEYQGCGGQNSGTEPDGIINQTTNPYFDGNYGNFGSEGSANYYMNYLIGPSVQADWGDYTEYETEVANNNGVIHQAWGNMEPGQVVRFYTCPPTSETCNPSCMRYMGEIGWDPDNIGTFGYAQGVTSPPPVLFGNCLDCKNNQNSIAGGGDDPDYPIYGCTDPTASNYNAEATEDDGSCEYEGEDIEGCTDPEASNYNPDATIDDDSCFYPNVTPPVGCESLYSQFNPCYFYLVIDYQAGTYNSIMQQFDCDPDCFQEGCMDSTAENYNPYAIIQLSPDDCIYPEHYGFNCRPGHISGTGKCVAGTPQSPGQFDSMEECLKSGCEEAPTYANPFEDPNYGGPGHFDRRPTPTIPPIGPAPYKRASSPIRESFKTRLQKLANIRKKK